MSELPAVLALHSRDIGAIAVVLLVWVAFHRAGRRAGKRARSRANRRGHRPARRGRADDR